MARTNRVASTLAGAFAVVVLLGACSDPAPDVELTIRYSSTDANTEVRVTSDESRCRDLGAQRMLTTDDELVLLLEPSGDADAAHTLLVRLSDGLAFTTQAPFTVTDSGFTVQDVPGSVSRTDGEPATQAVTGAVVSGSFRCPA